MGLRFRLFLLVILPTALVLGGYGVMRIRVEMRQAAEAERRQSAVTARAVQIALEHDLRDRQLADIQRLVSELVVSHAQIERILVVDRALKPLAAQPPVTGAGLDRLKQVIASGQVRHDFERPNITRYALPLRAPRGGVLGAVEIAFTTSLPEESLIRTIWDVGPRVVAIVLFVTALTLLAIHLDLIRPLGRLSASIQAVGEGRLGPPLPASRRDELGMVARAFNRMVEQLQAARARLVDETERALELEKQLRRVETLAVAGKLTSALAHEVGTPLNIISGRAEIALRALPPDHPARGEVTVIAAQAERISSTIRSVLDSVRGHKPEVQRVDLASLLPQLGGLMGYEARRRRIVLEAPPSGDMPPLLADPGQLQQVLLNLLTNALDATPAGGRVRLEARATRQADGRPGVAVTVSDSGPGIPAEILGRIFDPFFTTKPAGQGTGLGLAICRDIVREHGGTIDVQSQEGRGTTFEVWVPAAEASA